MIFHDVTQGAMDWQLLRLGIPTAGGFGRIVTPKTLELSSSADRYIAELAATSYLGVPLDSHTISPWMDRGKIMEAQARSYLEITENITITNGGFCTTDD